MQILLTSLYYYPKVGGVENSLRYMAKELKRLGCDVAVMSFDNHEIGKRVEDIEGIKVFRFHFVAQRIPFFTYQRLKRIAQKAIEEVLEDFEADQIWSRNTIVAAGLIKSKKVDIVKHIFSTTTYLNVEGLYTNIKKEPLHKQVVSLILKNIDSFTLSKIDAAVLSSHKTIPVVFSKMMYEQIQKEYNIKCIVHVINPGVDTDIFNNNQKSRDIDYIMQNSAVLDRKYVLYVGRIAPAKNLEILIDAIKKLKNINLLIAGDGGADYVNRIKDLIKKSETEENVFFMGKQSKMLPVIYSRAKVTILPTRIETFGQVLIESLACGTPVIGFGSNKEFMTAVDEIVTNEYNGEIVSEYCSDQLARAISSVLEKLSADEDVIRKYNMDYVKRKYNWENTIREIMNLSL